MVRLELAAGLLVVAVVVVVVVVRVARHLMFFLHQLAARMVAAAVLPSFKQRLSVVVGKLLLTIEALA